MSISDTIFTIVLSGQCPVNKLVRFTSSIKYTVSYSCHEDVKTTRKIPH